MRRGLPPLTCSDIGLSLRGLKNTWEFRFGLSFASTGLGPWAQGGERLPRRVMWVRAAAEGWAVMFVWRPSLPVHRQKKSDSNVAFLSLSVKQNR